MRTAALARVDGRMKVVSDRLNCSASACMAAVSRALPSSTTHSGFPLRRSPPWVNTFTMRKPRLAMHPPLRLLRVLRHEILDDRNDLVRATGRSLGDAVLAIHDQRRSLIDLV